MKHLLIFTVFITFSYSSFSQALIPKNGSSIYIDLSSQNWISIDGKYKMRIVEQNIIEINGKNSAYTWGISNRDETSLYLFLNDTTKDVYQLYIVKSPSGHFRLELKDKKGKTVYTSY